jgi:peptidoglycan/LPS O-acetylase OafA/YrhL
LIASAVVPVLLALAMRSAWRGPPSPSLASLALALAAACGIAAAVANSTVLALAPLIAAVAAMVGVAILGSGAGQARAPQAVAAALSFLAGASIHATGGAIAQMGLMLFSAAGLLGVSLALARDSDAAVDESRTRNLRRPAIR